jgi:hypothetical protein
LRRAWSGVLFARLDAVTPKNIGAVGGLALAGLMWLACTVQYSSTNAPPAVDAGLDVLAPDAADAGAAPDADIPLAKVPGRPSTEDGDGNLSLVFALRTLAVDPGRDADLELQGYDLDGVATCPGASSCTASASANICDGPGGRDNALLAVVRSSGLDIGPEMNRRLALGFSGLLIAIEDYNGGKNDRQVTVSLYAGSMTQSQLDGGGPDPTGTRPPPASDGTDYWRVYDNVVAAPPDAGTACSLGTCRASIRDTAAYVTEGRLVSLLDLPIPLELASVDLRSGYMTGRLTNQNNLWTLDKGVFGGRILVEDIFRALSDPFVPNQRLCDNPASIQLIKPVMCGARDLAADVKKDRTSEPCGALSVVVAFTAVQARLGTLSRVGDAGTPCPNPIRCD